MEVLVYNFKDKIQAVVFDLDGTIYFGNTLAEKANDVIKHVRERYEHIFFATNNSAITRSQLLDRLIKLGVDAEFSEIINSTFLIAGYLKDSGFKKVFCLGTDGLKSEIAGAGVEISSDKPEAIVIGYDSDFDLKKLEAAINVYHKDCKIIAANQDKTYPKAGGILAPGAGACVAAFEYTTGAKVDTIIGKPQTAMLQFIAGRLNLKPENILVVGDTESSDIKMANDFGAKSIFIENKNPKSTSATISIKELKELLEIL